MLIRLYNNILICCKFKLLIINVIGTQQIQICAISGKKLLFYLWWEKLSFKVICFGDTIILLLIMLHESLY